MFYLVKSGKISGNFYIHIFYIKWDKKGFYVKVKGMKPKISRLNPGGKDNIPYSQPPNLHTIPKNIS